MGAFHAKCTSNANLYGKTAVVTGSNTGIGKCTVKDFYQRGGRVIMACRNKEKAIQAAEDIKRDCADAQNLGEIVVMPLDLSSLKSVREFSRKLIESEDKLHLLVNNAGVMCPFSETEDGFEMQFQTNHLGHFLLTVLLLPKLIESAPSRVVNVSSTLHRFAHMDLSDLNWKRRRYSTLGAYYQSKLANILFAKELRDRLEEHDIRGVTTYSLHPGAIRTELSRHADSTFFPGFRSVYDSFAGCVLKSAEQGAQTTIYCAVDERCATESGLYYAECAVARSSRDSNNKELARGLWEESLKLVGLGESYRLGEKV